MNDRSTELKQEIGRIVDSIDSTDYLLRIRRLVRWCANKERKNNEK